MTKAKITASLLVIAPIVIALILIMAIPPVPIQNENKDTIPKSYITSETATIQFKTVWNFQSLIYFVNATQETYINFYNWTYNETSQIASKELIDSWRVDYTTKIIYNSTNPTETMQWAISQAGMIKISSGIYNITSTLMLNQSDTILIGEGGVLSYYGDGSVINFSSNVTNIRISHLIIDLRGLKNTSGLEIK
jgi:hypothetical protein